MIPTDLFEAGTTQVEHSAEVLSHFTAPRHSTRFWVAMWTAAVVVQLVALRPVLFPDGEPLPAFLVMYHVVGFAITSCGLAAWRRRPDSNVGKLMTTAGLLLYASPLVGHIPTLEARIVASILEDLWAIPMVALLLTHHSGGRLTSRVDRYLLAPFEVAAPHHPGRHRPVRPRGRESAELVADRVRRAFAYTSPDRITIATDCVMKYLPRANAEGKMRAMVGPASILRAGL